MGALDKGVLDTLRTGQSLSGEGGAYIPVNKGHFELDTDERIRVFHEKLAQGWEEEYLEYRRAWSVNAKNKIVREYPLLVDLELASTCNLSCPMCPTVSDHFKKTVPLKFMELALYKKIIDEIAGKVYAIRLSWRGESTLHPHFAEAIRYAKDKGIREVSFLTNASKLTLKYFEEIAGAGIDWITVSFDGLNEEYNQIRKPLVCEETLQKLRFIQEYKMEKGLSKPVVKVQGVWPAIRKTPEKFYNTLAAVSDLVAFNPLIDYLRKDDKIVYSEGFSCAQLYQRLVVASDGRVSMCTNDDYSEASLGNAGSQTIHDIWHGEALRHIRELHSKSNGFHEIPVCSKCFYPRKTEVYEKVQVNGQDLLIEKYVNRSQEIGS